MSSFPSLLLPLVGKNTGHHLTKSPARETCTLLAEANFFLEKIPGRIKSADFFGQYAKKCKTVQLSNAETEVECPHIHFLSIQTLLSCHMVHMTYLTSVKYKICSIIVSRLVMIHAAIISCTLTLTLGLIL